MKTSEAEVLVTGATGLIGRWLLAALTRRGRGVAALVRGSVAREAELRAFVDRIGGDASRLVVVEGDVEQEGLGLRSALPNVRVVHHLAARFAFGLSAEDARRTNVEGTQHVVDWASAQTRLDRFVFLGGYRMTKIDLSTLDAAAIARAYAAGAYEGSKVEAFALFTRLARERGFSWTAVHPSGLLGDSRTGETTQLVGIGETVQRLFAGELPALVGSARTFLPVVTVDYLADYLASVPDRAESAGRDLVVFDPASPALPALVAMLARHLGVRAPSLTLPIGLVSALPSEWTGLSRESLRFLSEDAYDTAEGDAHARAVGLSHPPLAQALARWCDFLISTRFLARPDQREGRLVRGTFTIGDPARADVVLLHGIPFDADAMAPLAAGLGRSSARVDLPGLGRSAPRAIDAAWLADVLEGRGRPVTLIGHSLGAAVAVRYAAAHPNAVRALVLVAPSFLMKAPSWTMQLRPLVARVLGGLDVASFEKRFLGDAISHEAREAALGAHAALSRRGAASRYAAALADATTSGARAEALDAFRALRAHGIPILVLHTPSEPLVMDTLDATIVCLAQASGHNPHLTHAFEVAQHVRRWLDTRPGPSSETLQPRAAM